MNKATISRRIDPQKKEEKQAKIKQLREKLKSLTDQQRAQLLEHCIVATIEGRQLSPRNTMLCYFQHNRCIRETKVGPGY